MQSLTTSLIQSELFWEDTDANLHMLEAKIDSIQQKTELILLPEMFSTGFSMDAEKLAEDMDGKTVNWMRELSGKKRAAIAGSLIIREDGHYFNRLILMLPNGEFYAYDKRHLFSYAGEQNVFSRGNKKLIGKLNGWKLNFQVCYDLRFPVWSRQPPDTEMHYDIYINVANWPSKRHHAWQTLLTARAIENQCYAIGVNRVGKDGNGHLYSGGSQIVDPLGNIVWECENKEDIYTYTFEKKPLLEVRLQFPFLKDADEFRIVE